MTSQTTTNSGEDTGAIQKQKIKISNQLDSEVTIYDAYDKDCNGIVTYKSLGIIPGKEEKEIQPIHTNNTLVATLTEIMNSKTYYFFPAKVISVVYKASEKKPTWGENKQESQTQSQTTSFAVSEDDLDIMKKTFVFIRFYYSYPNSKVAKDFNSNVLNKSTIQGTSSSDLFKEFFNRYTDTQGCTEMTWNFMTDWMQNYASPWQGTYYLYNVSSASGDSVKLIATVVVNSTEDNSNSATLTMENGDGGPYTLDFEAASATEKDGKKSFQLQNFSYTSFSDNVSILLTPSWSVVSVTKDGKTTKKRSSCMSGAINNTTVSGSTEKKKIPPNKSTDKKTGTNTAQKYFNYITGTIGTLSSLTMLGIMYKQYRATKKAGRPTQEAETNVKSQIEKVNEDLPRTLKFKNEFQSEQQLQNFRKIEINTQEKLSSMQKTVNLLENSMESNQELDATQKDINVNQSKLNEIVNDTNITETALNQLKDVNANLKKVNNSTKEMIQDNIQLIETENQTVLNQEQEYIEDLNKQNEEIQEEINQQNQEEIDQENINQDDDPNMEGEIRGGAGEGGGGD